MLLLTKTNWRKRREAELNGNNTGVEFNRFNGCYRILFTVATLRFLSIATLCLRDFSGLPLVKDIDF